MTRISRIAFLCSMMGGAAVLASACGDARAPERVAQTKSALSTTVVISQFYGHGGSTGAAYQNDYVELFNMSGAAIDIGGWSLQYAAAANNFSQNYAIPTGTMIDPGKYALIKLGAVSANGAALPATTLSATFSLSQTGGKIALVNNAADLTCGATANPCASGDAATGIVDYVGYGTATDNEGTAAAPSSTLSNAVFRALNGCVDTDQNAADFAAAAASPRSPASPATICGVDGGVDAATDGATDAAADGATDAAADGATDDAADAAADGATDGVVLPDVVMMPDTMLPDAASEVAVDAVSSDTGTADAAVDAVPDAVIADAVADAPKEAATDAGADTATTDTGTAPEDTGTAPEDTGTLPSVDTGSSSTDTGTTDTGLDIAPAEVTDDSGCGCSTPRSTENSAALAGIALGLAVLARRRRQD